MNRNQTKLFFGIALAISCLFASQTFAASGCITSACDPAAAAAACDPAAATPACDPAAAAPACDPADAAPACDPVCTPTCDTGCLSDAPICGSGCLSDAPSCGACSNCGNFGCNGFCGHHGCADAFFGKLKKSFCEGVCWSGFMNGGYYTNFNGNRSNGYADCWSNSIPAFNTLYVSATKKAFTGGCGYDFGFGVDFAFGEDTRLFRSVRGLDQNWYTGHMYNPATEAYDLPSYGFAMPQLYMEMAINNWTFKAGHFYGLLGYEGATANSRFFYTKGLICAVSPVAQTGALATYKGFQNLDITLGWVNGWNNGFDNSEYGEGMVEGAFTYRMNEYASVKYAFLAGTSDIGAPLAAFGSLNPYAEIGKKGDTSVHTAVIDLQLTGRLETVYLLYYGDFDGNTVLGLGQHAYYDLNCCTKVGFRGEWMKATIDGEASELTTFGIGLNYHPAGYQNLVFRPELRYDRVVGDTSLLNNRVDQITIGFDIMLTF